MAIVDPAQQSILDAQLAAQQAAAAAVPPVAVPPVAVKPGVVPLSPALAGVSPLAIPATIQDPAAGLAGADTILGMTPEQFQAVVGGIGQALAPPDTWQSRLGGFAKRLGQAQIIGGITGEDITGTELTPETTKFLKAPKKSRLKKPAVDEVDLGNALQGGI